MQNKTATAVVLALLGVADAATGAFDPQPTALNFATNAGIKNFGCTGGDPNNEDDLEQLNPSGLFATELAKDGSTAASQQWACYQEAAALSAADTKDVPETVTKEVTVQENGVDVKKTVTETVMKTVNKNQKLCVQYRPKSTNWDGTERPTSCHVFNGYGVQCNGGDDPGAQSVYMLAGAFQADPAVREASCTNEKLTQPVQRWCRCANWRHNGAWAPLMEDFETNVNLLDSAGNVVYKKDANGAILQKDGVNVPEKVMGKRAVTFKADGTGRATKFQGANADVLLKDVNGNYVYEMVYTEANCDYGLDAAGVKIPIPGYETNWEQLPALTDLTQTWGVKWLATCPTNWEVPVDKGVDADRGSFKGYTNRYTFSKVADDKHEEGNTVTWDNESEEYKEWTDVAKVGAIAGFGTFGIAILLVVAAIAVDMRRRMQMYEELIAEDLDKIQQMGLGNKMAEFQKELAVALAGGVAETGVDDQLVTQALELRPEDFSKHM